MAKLPAAESVSAPSPMGPAGPYAEEDFSGLISGLSDLSRGAQNFAGSMQRVDQVHRQRQNTADLTRAESEYLKRSLDLENRLVNDPGNYRSHSATAATELDTIRSEIAANIRDEDLRQRWLDDNEQSKIRFLDAVTDRGQAIQNQEDRISFGRALEDSAALIMEPSTDEAIRNKARSDIAASITEAQLSGLILPAEADEYRRNILEKSEVQLAFNRANLEIERNPNGVRTKLGISSAMGGMDIAMSAAMASAGNIVPLDPGVAALAAEALGDEAFPDDPELQKAYLSDPAVNAQYATIAMELLADRYKGDMDAAIIASAPGGGTALADAWVKQGKNDALLPASVREYRRKVLEGIAPEADYIELPVLAEDDVDLAQVDAAVLDRYEKLQGAFGEQLTIISGYRDPQHNHEVGGASRSQHMDRRALDINVAHLSKEERVRFIELASAAGFTGIGVYDNTIHIDTGSRRAWGPSHGRESVPAWAEDVIAAHAAGEIVEVQPNLKGVAPEYRALSFEQRMQLDRAAKAAADQQGLDMRSSIDVAVQNAPAAIMQTGSYSGEMPTAQDFVQAWGAADGINRFKEFEKNVDIAEAAHGMQTMSAEEIAAVVQEAMPRSTGDSAAVEGERFQAVLKASEAVLEARAKDPAGYVMGAFPSVQRAFAGIDAPDANGVAPSAEERSRRFTGAISMMAQAQEQLGIDDMRLLPADMATQIATTFNDVNLSQAERMGAVSGMVLQTSVEEQQEAIMDQLIAAGVPANTEAAMAALVRGDSGSAAYLFRAAMTDASKMPLPANVVENQIEPRIDEMIFDDDQIGDVVYGLTFGTAENLERLAADRALIESAVRLRLADGSAGNLDQAINLTIKDMYGDVKVDVGGRLAGVKITLPVNEDPAPLHQGFDALLPQVGDAIMQAMTPAMSGAATSDGTAQVLTAARDVHVEAMLSEGYFTNGLDDDEYVFIDPSTGTAVAGPDGTALTFTRDEVLQAGVVAEGVAPARQDAVSLGLGALMDAGQPQ